MSAGDAARRARASAARRAAREERAIVAGYGRSWRALKRDLDEVGRLISEARARGERTSGSWLLRQRGLRSAVETARMEVNLVADLAARAVSDAQLEALLTGRLDAEDLVRAQLPPGRAWSPAFPTEGLRELVGFSADGRPLGELLAELGPAAGEAVRSGLVRGMALGRHPTVIARGIRTALGGDAARAVTIARTEILRAYRESSRAFYRANSDVVTGWLWHATLDAGRTCPVCWAMHGTFHALDEVMATHPSCFPAGVIVSGPRAQAAVKRYYSGDLVELETAGGRRLAVTPNHPLLTSEGWVAAGEINEGDHLVCDDREQGVMLDHPDHEQVPARIEEVTAALARSRGVVAACVPSSAEDFHGDGMDGHVDVVSTHGRLPLALVPALREPQAQGGLRGGDAGLTALAGERGTFALLLGSTPSPSGGVGGGRVAAVLGIAPGGHHDPVRLRDPAAVDAGLRESPRDDGAGDPVGFGEGLHRLARAVAFRDLGDRQWEASQRGTLRDREAVALSLCTPDHALDQDGAETQPGGVMEARSILTALTGQVGRDRVIKRAVRRWSGHVYNLETETGWYIANGIVAHNCRCAMVPVSKPWADLGFEGVKETRVELEPGPDVFGRLPAAAQRRILGPGKHALYADGRISLPDVVVRTRHRRWGPGRREATIDEALSSAAARAVPEAGLGREIEGIRTSAEWITPAQAARLADDLSRSGYHPRYLTETGVPEYLREQVAAVVAAGERIERALRPSVLAAREASEVARASADRASERYRKVLRSYNAKVGSEKTRLTDLRNGLFDEVSRERFNVPYGEATINQREEVREVGIRSDSRLRVAIEESRALVAARREVVEMTYRETIALHESASEAARAAIPDYRDGVRAALASVREMGPGEGVSLKVSASPALRGTAELIEDASAYYPREWIAGAREVVADVEERGFMRVLDEDRVVIAVSKRESPFTDDPGGLANALHELAHEMEGNPVLEAVEGAFYQWRTRGRTWNGEQERTRRLRDVAPGSGYRTGEVTREDEFGNPYAGKDYGRGAYEVTSVGMEATFLGTSTVDAEHRRFVLGLLALLPR